MAASTSQDLLTYILLSAMFDDLDLRDLFGDSDADDPSESDEELDGFVPLHSSIENPGCSY